MIVRNDGGADADSNSNANAGGCMNKQKPFIFCSRFCEPNNNHEENTSNPLKNK